ncbi:MAG: hypothetical protein JRN68_01070 [Nitrososphaerota archaeon]|nr:hypothetical protein [Ferrimicrobium acidiphilum]MDG6933267.1 hypothetical protein [Nitrososphaerota archaeon]
MSLQQHTIQAEVRNVLGIGPEPVLQKTDGHPWKWTHEEYALEAADARRGQESAERSRTEIARREAEFLRSHKCRPKLLDTNTCIHCDRPMSRLPTKAERLKAITEANIRKSGRRSDYYNAILRRDQK